jgi:hypothetical protein
VFTYNRPRHTQRLLDALARCDSLDRCRVVIYSDGPKLHEHERAVAATRQVIREWSGGHHVEIVERATNRGLARAIVDGVTELVANHGRVIVLEDDLVPAPDFLSFMLAGLDFYAEEDRVAQIAGWLPTQTSNVSTDGLFLQVMQTWGWATWDRAWKLYRWHDAIDPTDLHKDPAFRTRFTLDGAHKAERFLHLRLTGEQDTWGVLWWYAIAKADKLVLHPRKSLIWNGGFDRSGANCAGLELFRSAAPAEFLSHRLCSPIRLPHNVSLNHSAMAATRECLQAARWRAPPKSRLARMYFKARRKISA